MATYAFSFFNGQSSERVRVSVPDRSASAFLRALGGEPKDKKKFIELAKKFGRQLPAETG
jgi:hypothetical protein